MKRHIETVRGQWFACDENGRLNGYEFRDKEGHIIENCMPKEVYVYSFTSRRVFEVNMVNPYKVEKRIFEYPKETVHAGIMWMPKRDDELAVSIFIDWENKRIDELVAKIEEIHADKSRIQAFLNQKRS